MSCKVGGCEKEVKYGGMCGMHYKRHWRHGNVHYTERPEHPQYLMKCKVEDCDNIIGKSGGTGYCAAHYNRMYKYGRLHSIIASKGEGTTDSNGYRVIVVEGRRVYEHIYLAEKALGKRLPLGAIVHHMNLDKADNHTPLNLVVCPDQTYHMLLHYRMQQLGYEEWR